MANLNQQRRFLMNLTFNYKGKSKEDFKKEIIDKLVKRRKELNMTQEEVNQKLGMSDSQVAKWETGVRVPILFHLLCWLDVLGMGMELRDREGNILTSTSHYKK